MDSRDTRHDLVRMTREEKVAYYTERSNKMFTFLRGVCSDGKHPNTARALGYARDRHKTSTRKSGEPYIIHPLSLACDAVGMNLNEDILLAMLLLHDVPEDEGTLVMDLPVDKETRRAVECMTIRKMPGETKLVTKRRYYENLSTNHYAALGKGFDRRHNLSTMARDMPKVSIVKNCFETWFFLIPFLKDLRARWPEYSNQVHTLRTDLTGYVNALSAVVSIDLSYKKAPNDELMNRILSAKVDEDLKKIPEIFITT
ncbi:hypothetical protein IKG16_00515 [Candidatus Saccharibacteria bacterium]|nr:hypothetical protein [Candidatus Saccharibacteria bacterium]